MRVTIQPLKEHRQPPICPEIMGKLRALGASVGLANGRIQQIEVRATSEQAAIFSALGLVVGELPTGWRGGDFMTWNDAPREDHGAPLYRYWEVV